MLNPLTHYKAFRAAGFMAPGGAEMPVELRALEPLGQGTAQVVSVVRRLVPFLVARAIVPPDLDPLVELIENDWAFPEGR